MGKNEAWTDGERDHLRATFGRVSTRDLVADFPGRTRYGLLWQAQHLRLHADRYAMAADALRQHSHDRDFFRVPSLECSYWAGLLAADGCLIERGHGVQLSLAKLDAAHVRRFAAAVSYDGPIAIQERPRTTAHVIRIWGAHQWHTDLAQHFGITPRKTLTLQPPSHLDEANSLAFIAGYIDGDGCIRMGRVKRWPIPLIMLLGTAALLHWVKEWCDRLAPSARTPATIGPQTGARIFRYQISGKRARRFASCILPLGLPLLARKWDVFH